MAATFIPTPPQEEIRVVLNSIIKIKINKT
jgi:hypothetical protein